MKSRFFRIVTPLLVLSFFLLNITPAFSSTHPTYSSDELTNRLKTGAYLQKTDNLLIIVDGQGETFLGGEPPSQKIARSLISNIGKTIPNIPHRRMLRIHGPKADRFQKDFSTIFGLYHIDAKGFTPIIATKTHAISDFDPLGMTFISATKDLRKLSGTHAVVLISDGINIPKSAIYESAYMKKKFGGSVCYYPVFIGNDPQGAKNMSTIAKVGGCGFLAQYEAVDSPAELTDYVEKIFFAKRRMPVQPVPVVEPEPEVKPDVPLTEAPLEPVMTDTEQVTEIVEEPAIPEIIDDEPLVAMPVVDDNIIILERQLPHDKVVTIELHVEFDLNKATLRSGYEEEIKKVADFMILYPETEALLEGHTCDLGSEAYNQQLSSRRANTVKNYLVKNFGINPDRLKTRGAGESEPIAQNSSEEGRMKNRRVMAVISTIVTDYVIVEQEILKSDFLRDDFILPPVDEIVDEMMQQEVVETPQEDEMLQDTEVTGAPESDSMLIEEPPAQPTSQEEVTEVDMQEVVEVTEEPSITPTETQEAPAEESIPAPQTMEEEEEVDSVFDAQEEGADQAEEVVEEPLQEEPASSPSESMETTAPPAETPSMPAVTEDVVVVSPGESAFDEEGTPEPVEEMAVEPVDVQPEAPAQKTSTEEDSYL